MGTGAEGLSKQLQRCEDCFRHIQQHVYSMNAISPSASINAWAHGNAHGNAHGDTHGNAHDQKNTPQQALYSLCFEPFQATCPQPLAIIKSVCLSIDEHKRRVWSGVWVPLHGMHIWAQTGSWAEGQCLHVSVHKDRKTRQRLYLCSC